MATRKRCTQIIIDTLRRWPDMPEQTLAKYICERHPDTFCGKDGKPDIQMVRNRIRYYTGKIGQKNRDGIADGSKIRHNVVHPPRSRALARKPYDLKPGLWLILADLHIPIHDQNAIEAAVEYGHVNKVDGIFLNGDVQDCSSMSYWLNDPRIARDFCDEVELVIDFFDWLRQEFPDEQIVFKPGNHEDRLHTYYQAHAPKLGELPMAEMEVILNLEHRGIEYLLRKQKVMAGKLVLLHGHEVRGGNPNTVNPARWLFLKAKSSAACDHFHRSSAHDEMNIKEELISTWSFGCLCDLCPDYNPIANNWNHGFGLINVEKDRNYDVESRRVLPNGKVV